MPLNLADLFVNFIQSTSKAIVVYDMVDSSLTMKRGRYSVQHQSKFLQWKKQKE